MKEVVILKATHVFAVYSFFLYLAFNPREMAHNFGVTPPLKPFFLCIVRQLLKSW